MHNKYTYTYLYLHLSEYKGEYLDDYFKFTDYVVVIVSSKIINLKNLKNFKQVLNHAEHFT